MLIEKSLSAAKKIIKAELREEQTNIDIGIMQINYRRHQEKFFSLEQMLDPKSNIDYGARLLASLHR